MFALGFICPALVHIACECHECEDSPVVTHKRNSRTFDPSYLALYPDGKKFCPQCQMTLPLTPDHWHVTKVGRARGYCKPCTNRLAIEYNDQRDRSAPPKRGKCHVCHQVRDIRWGDGIAICRQCARVFTEHGENLVVVTAQLKIVRDHNAEVEGRRSLHKSNEVFLPHPIWLGQYPDGDHRNCIKLEASLRGAVRVLAQMAKKRQQEEKREEGQGAVVLAEWKESAR